MDPRATDIVYVFVPIDPRAVNPERDASEFLDLFGGAIGSMIMGVAGLEHLSHFVDVQENLSDIQEGLLPIPRPQDVAQAIARYRAHPRPFALGEVPGVMVPVLVARFHLDAVLSRIFPGLSPSWRTDDPRAQVAMTGTVKPKDVPWRRRSVNSYPAPRLRPPFFR